MRLYDDKRDRAWTLDGPAGTVSSSPVTARRYHLRVCVDDQPENSAPEHVIGRPFVPGQSGNPGGRPKQVRAYLEAIHRQETPERVCEVVSAMRTQAIIGGKTAPACAKVYLLACGVPMDGKPSDDLAEKLRDAKPEYLDWLAKLS